MDGRTWKRFSTAFSRDLDSLGAQIMEMQYDLPSYTAMEQGELAPVVRDGLAGLGRLVSERRILNDGELGLYWSTTEAQARQGVTLDDMLRAWHIGLDVFRGWARERVAATCMPSQVVVDFLDVTIPWMHQGSAVSIDYYSSTADWSRTRDGKARTAFMRSLLSEETPRAELHARGRLFGLDPNACYHALRVRQQDDLTLSKVRAWLGIGVGPGRPTGIVADVDGDVCAIASTLPTRPIDVPVGVSAQVPTEELARAFGFAARALAAATALGLTGCHDVRSLGVHPALLDDHDVGTGLVERYVTPVEALSGSGCQILQTVRVYLDSQANYELAGSRLFVHPNTVRYRLRRFEEITGASLRDTESLVAVWWALERSRLRPNAG